MSDAGLDPIEPRPNAATAPLSFEQQRIWLLDQLNPGDPFFNVGSFVRLTGRLDLGALWRALDAVVARHEILRATYHAADGEPQQRIAATAALDIASVSLHAYVASDRLARAHALAAGEMKRPFDLVSGPLLRARLYALGDNDHALLLVVHHIATDGWSMGVLIEELTTLYGAFRDGVASPLLPIAVQYPDYAYWERRQWQGALREASLGCWRERLRGLRRIELPADRPRTGEITSPARRESLTLGAGLKDALEAIARPQDATLFMVLLAGFQWLLYQRSGEADVAVGSPIANRQRREIEQTIGLFMNRLILRTDLGGDPTFRELLARVQRVSIGAYARPWMPFERLLDEILPARDRHRFTPVSTELTLRRADVAGTPLPGLSVAPIPFDPLTIRTDFDLSITDSNGGLTASLRYNASLFTPATAQGLLRDYQRLLTIVAEDPERRPRPRSRPATPAAPDCGEDVYRRSNLSRDQVRVWVGQALEPSLPLYNHATAFWCATALDPDRFRVALARTVACTDALRTVFEVRDGMPWQSVRLEMPFDLDVIDLSGERDPVTAARALIEARALRPLDLSVRPFDAALIRLSARATVWLMNLHHIVSDALSIEMIEHRIAAFYDGREVEVGDTFASVVRAEREGEGSRRRLESERFWREELAPAIEPVRLYGQLAATGPAEIERRSFQLDVRRSARLRQLAIEYAGPGRTEDAARFQIFAALLSMYIARATGTRRLSIGVGLHRRDARATTHTVGLMARQWPLRVELQGRDTLADVVRRVGAKVRTLLRHRFCCLENPSHEPTHQVSLHVHQQRDAEIAGAPVRCERLPSGFGSDTLRVDVSDDDRSGRFRIDVDVNCSAVPAWLRHDIPTHFRHLLDMVLDAPASRTLATTGLTPIRRVTSRRASRAGERFRAAHELVAAVAAHHPERAALEHRGHSTSYGDLNRRANRLARLLLRRGVGPEARVAVCLERSADLVTTVLAIFKAGGAHVPLDPAWPRERLALLLASADARVLVTNRMLAQCLPAVDTLCLDDEEAGLALESDADLPLPTDPRQLACMLFTSGSTGTPKSVLVEHGSFSSAYADWKTKYHLAACLRHLQIAGITSDVFMGDVVRALSSGGTLVLCSSEEAREPSALYDLMTTARVQIAELTPTVLRTLVAHVEAVGGRLPFMRCLIVGSGPWLAGEHRRVAALCGVRTRVVNAYGVTEATIDSAFFDGSTSGLADEQPTPIGAAFPHVQLHVLDRDLLPAVSGVAGELYIGGPGVARGYARRPGVTAECFVPDPFATAPGRRLYRTGDAARVDENGRLVLLGHPA